MSGQDFERELVAIRKRILDRLKNHEAEDVFQEVAFRAFQKAVDFEDADQMFAYCWAGCVRELRRDSARANERRRIAKDLQRVGEPSLEGPQEDLLDLEAICRDLSNEEQAIVYDLVVLGKTTRETGASQAKASRTIRKVGRRMQEAA